MNKRLLLKLTLLIAVLSSFLYSYIDKQNELTKWKMQVPEKRKQINALKEENKRMQYEINQFENPTHLLELSRSPQYSHLKHPFLEDVLTVQEGVALEESIQKKEVKQNILFPLGAK